MSEPKRPKDGVSQDILDYYGRFDEEEQLLYVLRCLEEEPSLLGASAHLMPSLEMLLDYPPFESFSYL